MLTTFGLILLLGPIWTIEAKVFHTQHPEGRYKLSYEKAHQMCKSMGSHLATYDDLKQAYEEYGYESCHCGWLMDRSAHYPMNSTVRGCGGRPGIHRCSGGPWNAYCYQDDPVGNCSAPLGMEMREIGDHQIESSSFYRTWYGAFWYGRKARLNNRGMFNAWIPSDDNKSQYLQVDLLEPKAITGVVTQGVSRYNMARYVSQYTIQYSKDGTNWKTFKEQNGNGLTNKDEIFDGNFNKHTPVRNMFWKPILAQYIRIVPFNWYKHIALRVELLGCEMSVYDEVEARARDISVSTSGEEIVLPPSREGKRVQEINFVEMAPPDKDFN